MALAAALGLIGLAGDAAGGAEVTLVSLGSSWRYLDDGSDQGTAWREAAFDDGPWSEGPAQLGYGDGDESTLISFGDDPNAKFITTYFRHAFTASGTGALQWLQLELLRDDGAVVYLNGTEVVRSNLPQGPLSFATLASPAGSTESQVLSFLLDPALLVEGSNALAVEIHQSGPTSSDISFDLALVASDAPPPVTRGPYLQLGTPSSVVVRWRTSAAEIGRVRYGTSPGALTFIADETSATTEHEVRLAGLTPETAYTYSVGIAGQVHAGGDVEHRFVTPPVVGIRKPTRIWVLGDSGTADQNAVAVRDAFTAFAAGHEPDLWLMLGDNAYDSGTDGEYQAAVFDTYPRQLRRQVLWPTLGNHDGILADSATQTGPYYEIFTLPTSAEAGGMPSGTEAYYSFDWANLHFVVLDSHDSDPSPTGAMLSWLEDDLMAAASAGSAEWIVAFWHHPPYTKGSHDSDSLSDSGGRMTAMRQNVLPLLEDWGVDLVLTGHSHSYERSLLLDSHYGASATFGSGFVLDGGDGRPDGDGPYVKPTPGPAPHEGAVYVVAGSSGKTGGGSLDHPAMLVGLDVHGSLVLDVKGLVLEGTLVQKDGTLGDRFALVKGSSPFIFVDGFESGDPLRWGSSVP